MSLEEIKVVFFLEGISRGQRMTGELNVGALI
jgi:hypothetical protein